MNNSQNMLIVAVMLALSLSEVSALWPNQKPYSDLCKGFNQGACSSRASLCVWKTNQYALCAEQKYASEQAPIRDDFKASVSDRFFEFSPGVHLSEGANQQWWYNLDRDDCARKCLAAASSSTFKARCLSFDFFPFESPKTEAPWNESPTKGVCVLNSESKDLARLRSEDQGFTDAELLYKSHFTKRPFSKLDGYYEIRDPRGGHIAKMLDYDGSLDSTGTDDDTTSVAPMNIWPQTRWGMYHFYIPPPIEGDYICDANGGVIGGGASNADKVFFRGGFTPVDLSQHCPGVMGKEAARNLCESIGGELCSSNELKKLIGKNIGCGYDTESVWASGDSNSGQKFTRCCATYNFLSNCQLYTGTNLKFCSGLKTLPECVRKGSGFVRQELEGFGGLIDQMRNNCAAGTATCSGLVSDWKPRDKCVWCVKSGSTGNEGECYPGNDYGICPNASLNLRKMFELKIKTYCPPINVCRLANKYPHIAATFSVPTTSPTTFKPTTDPTARPSKSPNTGVPSNLPTFVPTKMPTNSPTFSPTQNPVGP